MIPHRVFEDKAIDFANAKRRRVRILVERGIKVESKEVRDLAMHYAKEAEKLHGRQLAIAVQFYEDILTTFGILGSWDRCPGGRWANAVDAPDLPQMWVIITGSDSDVLLKMQRYLQEQARHRHHQ